MLHFHHSLFISFFVFNSQTSISFEKFHKGFYSLSVFPFFHFCLFHFTLCKKDQILFLAGPRRRTGTPRGGLPEEYWGLLLEYWGALAFSNKCIIEEQIMNIL